MIIVESLPFIGWFFFLVFPVMAYIEFFKAIKRTIEDRRFKRKMREINADIAETQEYMRKIELEFAEIRQLQEAIRSCSDEEELHRLRNRLDALLHSY